MRKKIGIFTGVEKLCPVIGFSFSLFVFSGEVLGFENLVFSVFEFIHGLIETPKFKRTVKKFLDDLIYFLVLYMQITEEQVMKAMEQ